MTASVEYVPDFLSAEEAASLFERLLAEVDWQREFLRLYGRTVPVPRLLAWFGRDGINYRYSGADHRCHGWHPALGNIHDRVSAHLGQTCNLVLLNRYRGGTDYMGWHRDDERGHGPQVASLSLGAPRRFLVRPPGESRSRGIDLEPGSLLVMDGSLEHSLPRTRRPVGERINLTFRHIVSAAA